MADPNKPLPLVSLIFVKNSPPYSAGEVAGFEAAEAKKLVDKGAAEYRRAKDEAVINENNVDDKTLKTPPLAGTENLEESDAEEETAEEEAGEEGDDTVTGPDGETAAERKKRLKAERAARRGR